MYRVQTKNSACVGCVHLLNFHLDVGAIFPVHLIFEYLWQGRSEIDQSETHL